MPIHQVHRIVGERICGFSDRLIDDLADGIISVEELNSPTRSIVELDLLEATKSNHDVGRISCSELLLQAEALYSRFRDKGVCYYILHHYLDKFPKVFAGQLLYRSGFWLLNDIRLVDEFISNMHSRLKEGFNKEVSTISVLTAIVEHDVRSFYDAVKYTNLLFDKYRRSTRKRKRRLFREIWEDCINVLTPERGAS